MTIYNEPNATHEYEIWLKCWNCNSNDMKKKTEVAYDHETLRKCKHCNPNDNRKSN